MAIDQQLISPGFSGTRKFQTLAKRIFDVLRARGMFMADDTPIRVPLDDLKTFLAEQESTKPADVDTAITSNPDIFAIETVDEIAYVVTTRIGKIPVEFRVQANHTFAERLMTPQPKPERPAVVRREPVRVDPNWATYAVPDYEDEEEISDLAAEQATEAPLVRDVIVEPAVDVPMPETVEAIEPDVPDVAPVEVEAPRDIAPAVEELAAPTDEEEEPVVEEPADEVELVVEEPPVVVAPIVEPEPEIVPEPVVAAPVARVALTDLSGFDDAVVAEAIESQLGTDPRIVRFAGQWMSEDRIPRLSRGELRRIKDYIEEQEQPLSDAVLVSDILNVRPNAADFEILRFAVSYRLSREHRDFEFVGTGDQRFWSTNSLPQIGTTRRKPNEIGTDYRFLTENVPADLAHRSVTSVDHVLSFYEFTLGLLPYDEAMRQLLPAPVLPDQRSAVLTFEIPQSYTTYLVELRYPTPNRGGFLLGLDDFYAESLVPGAMVSIAATENDGHYRVEFLAAKDQNARLLELDDRRSPRYQFRPTTFACEVVPEWLISEDRFPRLGSEKPLDDKLRRRPDAVVAATFERIAVVDGGTLVTTFDELLAAANIERPFSAALLRSTVEADARMTDDGADTLTYVAGA